VDRREALRLLASGAALRLVPAKMFAALREARHVVAGAAIFRTLKPDQAAIASAIADLIIPRTETPSASDVGVPQFMDLILTEWYTEEERKFFLDGLAAVDHRTNILFGKGFTACSPDQQSGIMKELGERMEEDAEVLRDNARAYRGSPPEPENNFYYMFRSLTLTGYYTSEEGATRELNFTIIPESHAGCATATQPRREQAQNP